MAAESQPDLDPIRRDYARHGQAHVFSAWERLDPAARARLLAQARRFDPAGVAEAIRAAHALADGGSSPSLEPVPIDRLPTRGGDPALRARACEAGEALLAEGSVAALVMAGGQGTRLGWEGPKGTFPLGPVSDRSLFGLQAQKLRRLARRYGRPTPWLVMTSEATDAPTRAHFAQHGAFGLDRTSIRLFPQASAPCTDFAGRLLLAAPDRIAESPDGHGGALPALVASGLVDELRSQGVRLVQTYQVDNPLVRIGDPVFLGLHHIREAEMSCKVIEKATPDETAGSVGSLGGRTRVVEYTEIDPAHREARGPDGSLRFWAASIGMHVLDLDLIERVGSHPDRWLPYHASAKRIPHLGPYGRTLVPDSANGYKLERFVFDALAAARGVALLEVERREEYAPIKHPAGEHSPQSSRRALAECARAWLQEAGIAGVPPEATIELDHERIDDAGDAARTGLRHVSEASEWILLGGGETT